MYILLILVEYILNEKVKSVNTHRKTKFKIIIFTLVNVYVESINH